MRALLVDFGGVLTTSVASSFAAFCRDEGVPTDAFRDVLRASAKDPMSPFARVERGLITQEEFDDILAGLLTDASGVAVRARDLKQRLFAGVRPDDMMRAAVRSAREQGVRTALLSNSWGGGDYPMDDLRTIFDALVISGEVGMRKPDPDIYLHTASLVEVVPDACVFIDDLPANIEGAEAVGMTGVLHRDTTTTVTTLEELLGVSLARG